MENPRNDRDFPERRQLVRDNEDRRVVFRRQEDNERTLTEADIDAIISSLEKRFTIFLGKAIWAAIQKVFITAVIAMLVYGYAFKGGIGK